MRRYFCGLFVIAIVAFSLPAFAQATHTGSYENNEAALKQFIEDILQASRTGDSEKLDALLNSLMIPDYEEWFAEVFGIEEAPRLTQYYETFRKGWERHRKQFREIARLKDPQIATQSYSASATNEGRVEFWKAVAAATKGKVSLYSTSYQRDGDSWNLGYFFYVGGGFRLVDELVMSGLSTVPPLRVRIGGNVQQAKLISQPRPKYPAAARDERIQGAVRLQAIIARDGTIKELEVLWGDPILAEAAVAAVKQWRYQPTLLNGVPVEVVTTIEVVFTLQL